MAVNEGGAIKSRACVPAWCVHCALCKGEEGAPRAALLLLLLRLSEERRGEERREGKKERAQINLLSSAVADRGRTGTGWPTALAGRADDFGDDGAR